MPEESGAGTPGQVSTPSPNDAGAVHGAKRERRIADILAAAALVLQEEGYAGFATRRVAARAGITLSNLQYYFSTKDELLGVVVGTFLQSYLDDYAALASVPGRSAQQRCAALMERLFLDIAVVSARKMLFETWALAQHESYAAELMRDAYATYRRIFVRLLSEINPELTHDECDVRALVLTAQAEGMVVFASRSDDSEQDRAAFARTTRRSVKLLAGLSGQVLDTNRMHDEGAAHPLADDGATTASMKPLGIFGSERHIRRARNEVNLRQQGHTGGYARATLQSRRREEKINEIVAMAADVLASEGYGNFTLARVAKKVGILTSGLQHYFPTHDDLLRSTTSALFATYYERWSEMGLPSAKPAIERLFEIIEEVFREACDPRVCRFSFEMFALSEHSSVTHDLLSRSYIAYRQIYVDLVKEIDPSASGRECFARATLIAAQLEGLMVYTCSTGADTPGIGRVLHLIKIISVEIAKGHRAPMPRPAGA